MNKVVASLASLRDLLSRTQFPLPIEHSESGRELRVRLVHQLDDYLIPRYEFLEAPLLAVVGGSTGSGKSLLVNSLLGRNLAESSPIRPTTRRPLLVCAPADFSWFDSDRVLPAMPRIRRGTSEDVAVAGVSDSGGSGAEPEQEEEDSVALAVELATDAQLEAGLALLDSPDIDSVVQENRRLASQLLAAADLWVFVTTAARYSDAIPWRLLEEAAERNIVLAIVLNRVPEGAASAVESDLRSKLLQQGLSDIPLFVIPENRNEDGFIPARELVPLRQWFSALTKDAQSRSAVAKQTLRGAVRQLLSSEPQLIEAMESQKVLTSKMRRQVGEAFEGASRAVEAATQDGSVLKGEVLLRWQEVVGTGDWARGLESGVSSLRDKVAGWFKGRKAQPMATALDEALEGSLQSLLINASEAAIGDVEQSWSESPGSRESLGQVQSGLRSREQRAEAAALLVRDWQRDLVDLVSSVGADKKATARLLAIGVNVVGAALMVAIFASTAGLTGAEVVVAGGTAVAAQRVLEAVFGDGAVRKMVTTAKQDLEARCDAFFTEDAEPFVEMTEELLRKIGNPKEVEAAFLRVNQEQREGDGL